MFHDKAAVLAAILMSGLASSQSTTAAQTSASGSTATTSSADATWTNPLIQSLWGDAQSLLSSYYPSSSVTNVASLTWPSTVAIGSATYEVSGSSTLSTMTSASVESVPTQASAASSTATPSSAAKTNSGMHTDKRLGIGLGVGLGVVAIGLMIFLIWLLHRRRRRSGTFIKHRPASPSDSEITSWRAQSSHSDFPEKYAAMTAPRAPMPPVRTHPAMSRGWTDDEIRPIRNGNGDISEENPFYTPYDNYAELAAENSRQPSLHELHGESSMQMLSDHRPTTPVAESAMGRPSTPFSPELMRGGMMSPVSPISPADDTQQHGFWRNSEDHAKPHQPEDYANPYQPEDYERSQYDSQNSSSHHRSTSSNPFLSEEDDVVETPPSIPARSSRRSLPIVHYPSGDELSTFDFGIESERRRWAAERNVDGADGYRKPVPRRESMMGRHELS